MSDEEDIAKQVARILRLLAGKIEDNPNFLKDMGLAPKDIPIVNRKKKMEEPPIDLDVFRIFSDEGSEVLRKKMEPLDLRTLVRIIRQHRFDPSKLAEKWKDKERLINLILEKVAARSDKGKVFKEYP